MGQQLTAMCLLRISMAAGEGTASAEMVISQRDLDTERGGAAAAILGGASLPSRRRMESELDDELKKCQAMNDHRSTFICPHPGHQHQGLNDS